MSLVDTITPYLPYFWIFFMGLFLLYYAIADGMDLGVGILSLLPVWNERERHLMVFALKGVWSSNQTWLVVLIGMLFGAFPLFYSLVLSSLYIPMTIMLLGLIFRAVGIDMGEDFQGNRFWHLAFAGGSLVATIGQGFGLGGLLSGVTEAGQPAGLWAWLNPFSLLVAAGVVVGYVMLGATFLVVKTTGELREASYAYAIGAAFTTAAFSVGVYTWTILRYDFVVANWRSHPEMGVFPLLAASCFVMYVRGLFRRYEIGPLVWMGFVVLLSFVGLSAGFFPYMIPSVSRPITIEQAAASTDTLLFMLAVTVVLLPIIIGYNIFQYWVFRRKVGEEDL